MLSLRPMASEMVEFDGRAKNDQKLVSPLYGSPNPPLSRFLQYLTECHIPSSRHDILMKRKPQDLIPAIPSDNGKLPWIIARIEQVAATLPTDYKIQEAWIEVSEDTALELTNEIGSFTTKLAGQVFQAVITIENKTLPISICVTEEGDDTSFELSLDLNDHLKSIETTGILGFCYPTPVEKSIIETRWVLQFVDGVPASTAASITAAI